MGSIRRRLTLGLALLCPAPAWAEVCSDLRPGWDGSTVTAFDEMLFLAQTPMVLILILGTALAVRLRSEWGGVAVVVGWSLATFVVTEWGSRDGLRSEAIAEGCASSPGLFIAVAAAMCIGVVLYTAPLPRGKKSNGE